MTGPLRGGASGVSLPSVLIAGGGTGGHVFPALAIADAVRSLADVAVVFAGTSRGLEGRLVEAHGYTLERFDVRPMKGGGLSRAVTGALVATRETLRSIRFLRRVSPRWVLSMGGFVAGPVSLAAVLVGIPLALVEPNRVAGVTNRILARFATRAYLPHEGGDAAFAPQAIRRFGVPLRSTFFPRPYAPSKVKRILVLGGSQGASALNERLPAAIEHIRSDGLEVEVVHQAGDGRDQAVREAYARHRIGGVIVVPFLTDMADAIAHADLIIARAGSGTVAEIAAVGRASILIPFPFAADDHQAFNAAVLTATGGALLLRQDDADPARIAREVTTLLRDEATLARMATAVQNANRPDAAIAIARDLVELAGLEGMR